MNTAHRPLAIAVFLGLLLAPPLFSQQATAEQKIRDIQSRLSTEIRSAKLQEKMPFERFLQTIAKQLPAGKEIRMRIEKEAFGILIAVRKGTRIAERQAPD